MGARRKRPGPKGRRLLRETAPATRNDTRNKRRRTGCRYPIPLGAAGRRRFSPAGAGPRRIPSLRRGIPHCRIFLLSLEIARVGAAGRLPLPCLGGTSLQPQPAARRPKPPWREYAETVIGAVVLALVIMAFVGRAFTVDGPSMSPTLRSGERLLVDKLTYRFRDPVHGEIVVFRYPRDPSHYFIKRVIGVPGDQVAIRSGQVYVNGVRLEEGYLDSPTLGADRVYNVPPGSYFVLGDNRNNSQDSRSPFVGFVPRSHIVGRAFLRYWPPSRVDLLIRDTGTAYAAP